MASRHDSNIRRWSVGEVRVTRILELQPVVADPSAFIRTDAGEVLKRRDWLCPDFATDDGRIRLHFQAFVIEAAGRRIMVDPCIGNDKPRRAKWLNMLQTDFLQRLAAAGFPRDRIDYVLCTHLHVDHCGWNTMLIDGAWVPTFPNARYLFASAELDHARRLCTGDAPVIFADSVQPIFDADLADIIDPGHVIVDGVWLEATPGHTPGHCSVGISSAGEHAVITGDVLHHPVQLALPDVSSNFCADAELATRTRRALLRRASASNALLLGSHFAGPTGVYLQQDGDAWRVRDPAA